MAAIGVFGGSFNPVHRGHVALAEHLRRAMGLDEVWLSVSPLNPLKSPEGIAPDADRMAMLRIAVEGMEGLRASDVELRLPRPSYTIDTLRHLRERYPATDFRLIIGADNWLIFNRWKDYETIAREFCPIVYPRPGFDLGGHLANLPHEVATDAPVYDIASTDIRRMIACGDPAAETFLPPGVFSYIRSKKLYLEN